MADPRASVDYTGLHADYSPYVIDGSTITFDATKERGSAAVDLAVTLSAARTVALAADGDAILGKLISVDNDTFCTVQTDGYMQLPGGTGASLTLGKAIVGALLVAARGYIREVATATAAELGKCNGMIIDASDTANVWVDL